MFGTATTIEYFINFTINNTFKELGKKKKDNQITIASESRLSR